MGGSQLFQRLRSKVSARRAGSEPSLSLPGQ
jgi:hypothetical protein